MSRYNPKAIETKWQKTWAESGIYSARDFDKKRPKYVMLTEFPYPSGAGMHIGHIREYTLGDIIARQKRMLGFNVLYPMGYDAFGLPTENYAIKNKIAPQQATEDNIKNFQRQLVSMGFSFDWSRSFRTTDPRYYRWTQWLFLQFFKKGMAYQSEIAVNWCPFCKTGLSNEEVINGRHERCDTPVEKKLLKQWMLRITDYADRLIEGLDSVDYPKWIAEQQINWIGRSKGAEISFRVDGSKESIKVFTTRPDTVYGATFLVLAPEHPLVKQITTGEQKESVNSYIHLAASKTDVERQEAEKEKSGVFTGAYALNPASGKRIEIWIADYILMGYGTGAIMAVPAHDERDFEFASKYELPVKQVVSVEGADIKDGAYSGEGVMVNSGKYNGIASSEMRDQIVADLAAQKAGKERVNYRLRDWIFSRQRYWGEPIPIIHCPKHGPVAVPDQDLPVELPKIDNYEPTQNGESPLALATDWVNTTCPECGAPAKRETDTMPNWAGSSWYYLRYFDPQNNKEFAAQDKLKYWQDVDLYLGGTEHITLHLLYSRFWHQFFFDQGLVPTPEPYMARRSQGIILAADGSKMSKSKGNIVDPSEVIDSGYGADALRLAVTFLAPYDQTTPWSPETLGGTYRFLQRVWTLVQEYDASEGGTEESTELKQIVNRSAKRVGEDLLNMSYNTAIAGLMECVNELYKVKAQDGYRSVEWQWALETLVKLLSPFAPHITEELWEQLGGEESVHSQRWPGYEEAYTVSPQVVIAIQVNGKLRGEVAVAIGADQERVREAAEQEPKVKKYLAGKIEKVIFVPDRIINFLVK